MATIRGRVILLAGLLAGLLPAASGLAETVLRVGMTAADVPATTGQPDQGAEGWRFMGVTVYDSLVSWDLSRGDQATPVMPDLATEWSTDPSDRRRWTFKLRQGVTFHDGSPWNAAAALWNFDKLLNKTVPQYDGRQLAQTLGRLSNVESYRAVDEHTFEVVTKTPDALFHYGLVMVWFSSPAQFDKVGRDWAEFAKTPSGTGPWKLDKLVPRERAELVRNAAYWDPKRVPKTDRLVLMPIPDSSSRTAALLTGQVDWIEAPSPDAVPRLKQGGMHIVTNSYPHIWPYQLSRLPDSPFNDIRVRQAANLAIDRDGLVKLLGGLAMPAVGQVPPGHPWFGNPSFKISYDPARAKQLLAEAGYGPDHPLKAKFLTSTSGSGQMQPLPMNEYVQANLKAVGIDVELEVLEWNTLRTRRAIGAQAPDNKGAHGTNSSWSAADPDFGFIGLMESSKIAPAGNNWGNVKDPVLDALSIKIRSTFDPVEQDRLVGEMHARMVDEAVWIWVVHDLNPRALSPRVHGFVQARNWVQDLTSVEMK
ncbi:MAG: ABC transporter substrate-binding protein [Pseudomonadota bacterium]